MMFKFYKYTKYFITNLFFISFIFAMSCGKKNETPRTAKYGPLTSVDSAMIGRSTKNTASITIANCEPGERISCDGQFNYNFTSSLSEVNAGGRCSNEGKLTVFFPLIDCLPPNTWSGSVSCTSSKSRLVEIKPLSLQNVSCV